MFSELQSEAFYASRKLASPISHDFQGNFDNDIPFGDSIAPANAKKSGSSFETVEPPYWDVTTSDDTPALDELFGLLALQQCDGSFLEIEIIASFEKSIGSFGTELLKEIPHEKMTLSALYLLNTKYLQHANLWRRAERKAKRYLIDQGIETVLIKTITGSGD